MRRMPDPWAEETPLLSEIPRRSLMVTTPFEGTELPPGPRRTCRFVSVPPEMRRKPTLLVDVDGVISLFGFAPNKRPDGLWTQVDGSLHLLSPTAATHLLDLMSHFDPVWCTGWEERANENLPQLLGLGPWPVLHFDRAEARAGASLAGHWKLGAIDAHLGPDHPVAWVDDVLDEPCRRWAAVRPGPTLLVPTAPAAGLTATEAAALMAWAASLA